MRLSSPKAKVRELGWRIVVIYDIGSPSEVLYIVKSGRVALDALYEIERTNSIPVA